MDELAVPPYFICPISLQIMKDPVTATTGITYDRESIENWFMTSKDAIFCPLTKQPLTKASDLTPNHTLHRLIKCWLVENATPGSGFDGILSPRPLLDKTHLRKLLRDLAASDDGLRHDAVRKLYALAIEGDTACRGRMVEVGVAKGMVLFVMRCFKEGKVGGLEEGLKILSVLESYSICETRVLDVIDSLNWVLGLEMENHIIIKSYAIEVLKKAIDVAPSTVISGYEPLCRGFESLQFFKNVTNFLRQKISNSALKTTLTILTKLCHWGRNRIKLVEVGAIFDLIALELEKPEKNITELIFNLLAHLCTTADGRAELVRHAGGIAVVSKRILRVSIATTDRAIQILSLISKHSARKDVLVEMLRVGAVSKLCMVMQSDCEGYLKEKAREILRMHSNVWSNSPCIGVYLMTRDPR
ncbi:E3 ubiquitin-protein ligase PUB24-like [Cucurbita pepo subsp. pepo]|uniref:E3 ubiquitin-protein ligase PUB24-like n=1 Tax=Cucurbita pepo subsp. pepo TaxID=3664 RepID=UPI000C9D7589|nr:E3 ubiquitin-protein ligase PUB24-like [Cucurbita pepo subsp. pepo]